MPAEPARGLLDTNIVILRRVIDAAELPEEVAISAVTLAELSAGVHVVSGNDARAIEERARRADVLARAEHEFDPIPFETEAARVFGRVSAAVQARGQTPRRRIADLMIASIAAASGLPLYTTNPDEFEGLDSILRVVAVRRPPVESVVALS